MAYIGKKPTDKPLTSADLADNIVTSAKIVDGTIVDADVNDVAATKLSGTIADARFPATLPTASGANLTSLPAANLTGTVADARISTLTSSKLTGALPAIDGSNLTGLSVAYDDNKLQSNIALLGFKTAVNGSLAKYNLQDQIIDEFTDATGIDASASTNENLTAGVYSGGTSNPTGATSTDTSVAGYRIEVLSAASGSLVIPSSGNVDILVVGGGGSGGNNYGGGGGAGGLIYKSSHALTAQTYAWVTGAGGAGQTTNGNDGNNGADSTWTDASASVEFTAKGGGGGGGSNSVGLVGGSAGGNSYVSSAAAESQTGQSGDSGTYGFGNDGSIGYGPGDYNPGGGGGAGSAGADGEQTVSGNGGTGKDYSATFGTAVGDSGWFASGGGGGYSEPSYSQVGSASSGGGTTGGTPDGGNSSAATANTGGGSGGGASSNGDSGNGGSGIILVRHAENTFKTVNNLTLQSTDTTASTANPDYADMVVLMEDAEGTATLNTDIKGYISEDSGVTFTQGTLVDEGSWGANKKIIAFHDLDISAQSGSSMCYKITTHNQSAGSKETKIHATSIGWKA
jgi:hypothetical protein